MERTAVEAGGGAASDVGGASRVSVPMRAQAARVLARGASWNVIARPHVALRFALAALATLASLMLLAGTSYAGTYRVYSCRIPTGVDAGAPAPLETVEAARETPGEWDRIASGDVQYANTCSSGGYLMAGLEAGVPHSDADAMTWQFTAPMGETIVKASLWRAGDVDGGDGYLFWLAGESDPAYSELISSKVVFGSCAYVADCPGMGTTMGPLAAENQYVVPSSELASAHMFVNVACSLNECEKGSGDDEGYAAIYRIYATEMELEETSAPTVSDLSGELDTASVISAEAGLSFRAEDAGSGVYEAIVEVDGSEVQRSVLDEDEGRCAAVAEAGAATPAFLYPQPCPHVVDGHVQLDAATLAEGENSLRVLVTNAAGDETLVLERNVDVEHASAKQGEEKSGEDGDSSSGEDGKSKTGEGGSTPEGSAPPSAGSGTGSGSTEATASNSTGAMSAGANSLVTPFAATDTPTATLTGVKPNGTPSSSTARIVARWSTPRSHARRKRQALAIAYGRHARLEGTLMTATGRRIANALVTVQATPDFGGARTTTMRSVKTNRDGRFSLSLPHDVSSRRVELSYASTRGGSTVASTTLRLSVQAGLRLRISPRRTALGGTIRLTGSVLGRPIPHGGKEIVLEARSSGTRWLQFDVLHTNADGDFRARHRFRLPGPIGYSFRAVCPSEADFPFSAGASKAVRVWER